MLKVGGENVAAAEIESQLARHPAVQLVGVPDERLHEVRAAFIGVHAGSEVSGQELIEFCRGEIAGCEIPRHIRFVTV
jgi:acyl-CoA synthetase (AMP-forming)/AMP-acid ligase II